MDCSCSSGAVLATFATCQERGASSEEVVVDRDHWSGLERSPLRPCCGRELRRCLEV